MSDVERLVASIVHFLGDQLQSDISSDSKEGLEVAIQCLEQAYNMSSSDSHLLPSTSLLEIFQEAIKNDPVKELKTQEVSEEDKREAEGYKNEGNNLMKQEKFDEALKFYTKAIHLDGNNAIYYCNRAASYSKLNNHTFALEDCKRALQLDPSYGKAYGRMGLAYAGLNDHVYARDCYKKASELDPQNESYRNNLRIAEEKVREMQSNDPLAALGASVGATAFDISSILSNPGLMNMATQLMQDPNMQNLISGLVSNANTTASPETAGDAPPPDAGPGPGPAPGPGAGGFEAFLRAGQQLASQMQAANPDLVDQIRRQMTPGNRNTDNNTDSTQNGDKKE